MSLFLFFRTMFKNNITTIRTGTFRGLSTLAFVYVYFFLLIFFSLCVNLNVIPHGFFQNIRNKHEPLCNEMIFLGTFFSTQSLWFRFLPFDLKYALPGKHESTDRNSVSRLANYWLLNGVRKKKTVSKFKLRAMCYSPIWNVENYK